MIVRARRNPLEMERDMDLIRELLLRVAREDSRLHRSPASGPRVSRREFLFETPAELGFPGQPVEKLAYHIELLIEAGYLKGRIERGTPLHVISRLTDKGHDFVDDIRDTGIWEKTKKRLSGLPSVGLGIVAEIAKAEIKKHLGLP